MSAHELSFHPLADIFPMLAPKDLSALADDIAEHGLRNKIIMLDGMILDGRNRHEACIMAGVEPIFADFDGADALSFVVSSNLRRRHLDETQRAIVADKLAKLPRGSNQHASIEAPSQASAAKMLSVSRSAVQRVHRVRDHGASELVTALEQGEISAAAAATIASLPVEKQQELVAAGPAAVVEAAKEIRAPKRELKPEVVTAAITPVVEFGEELSQPIDDDDEVDPDDHEAAFVFEEVRERLQRMTERSIWFLIHKLQRCHEARLTEVARWIWQYRQGVPLSDAERDEYSDKVIKKPEEDAAIAALKAEVNIGDHIAAVECGGELGPLSVTAFCHWTFSQAAPQAEVGDFFNRLIKSANCTGEGPIYDASEKLVRTQRSRVLSRNQHAEIILRAWINHRSGARKKIKVTGELPTMTELAARGAK